MRILDKDTSHQLLEYTNSKTDDFASYASRLLQDLRTVPVVVTMSQELTRMTLSKESFRQTQLLGNRFGTPTTHMQGKDMNRKMAKS